MNTTTNSSARKASPRRRAPQQRAEDTRIALLEQAIETFSSVGYEGVSLRALEVKAEVQRGAVAYHFGDKETLWKRSVDHLLQRFVAELLPLEKVLKDLEPENRLRTIITAFVRVSAEAPQLNRLMVQEGRHDSWRLTYILETFVRGQLTWLDDIVGLLRDPHTYYIMIGASTFVFDVEQECRQLFDVDPTTDEFIKEHASRVTDMILSSRTPSLRKNV